MELINIKHNESGGVISARELHKFLEIKTEFTKWCKRMFEYGFTEGKDYIEVVSKKDDNLKGGRIDIIDYAFNLDMAKEISMIHRTEKGKIARQYFIQCEKELKSKNHTLPQTFSEALMLAAKQAEQIEAQQKLLEDNKPKVEFYEQVTGSKDAFDMVDVAKVCNLGVGRNKLFEFLRDISILRENNTPYQTYIDAGYFRVIESKYNKPDGSVNISLKTVVYQKGIDFIIKKYNQKNK